MKNNNGLKQSSYKAPDSDTTFLKQWNDEVQRMNGVQYQRIDIPTTLGNTVVWGYNTDQPQLKTLVYFPGARTCAFFLDMNNVLHDIRQEVRLFLVEVNGQPNLSDGYSPALQGPGYGVWVKELLSFLQIDKATLAGASLGGLICLKAGASVPEKISEMVLLNPAGISNFSLSFKNLYYNLLPIANPTVSNIAQFLDNAVFYKTHHRVPRNYYDAMVAYQLHTLTRFRYKAEKPAKAISGPELGSIPTPVHLIVGDKDILYPYKKTLEAAERHLQQLKSVHVVPDTGHGIETSAEAIKRLASILLR